MIPLPRAVLKSLPTCDAPDFDARPLQLGMHKDPWRVIVASVLLCRARREQAERVLRELPDNPYMMVMADPSELERIVRPCGLHRSRVRQLQRMSSLWLSDGWEDARELPGVGKYVADAIGLFCLGCKELESNDVVLNAWAKT